MRLRSAAPCLVLLALAAGCAQPAEEAAPAPERLSEEPEPETATSEEDFGWTAGVGVPTTGQDAQLQASNAASLDVPDDMELLTANVTWSCATPLCEMHVYLCDPEESLSPFAPFDGCAIHALGDSPVTLEADMPMPGDWTVVLHSDAPVLEVAGTIVMTAE